jgi:hypothetical protein
MVGVKVGVKLVKVAVNGVVGVLVGV